MKKSISLLTIFIFVCGISLAQQGNLGDEQINVVKAYQPMLSDAFKISDIPARDTAVNYIPDMKYEIRPEQYQTVYTITPIKPLRIKDENIKKLYHGFAKAGYGTKNTPYAEIFYNSLRSKSFDAGLHLKHISSTGKIKGYGYPGMSESGIKLFGTKFFEANRLEGELGYDRLVYHWYGYRKPPDIYSKSESKHTFDDFDGRFVLKSDEKDKDAFKYSAGIGFHNFNDNKSNTENGFDFTATAGKNLNDYFLGARFAFDFLKYETKNISAKNYSIVRLDPRFEKTIDRMKLSAGANIAVEINDSTKYHLYPHIHADFTLIDETLLVFGELTGNLERNSYKSIAKENPFLGTEFYLRNTNNKLEVNVGLNVKIDKQLAFIGSAGIKRMKNDQFFRNINTTNTLVIYDVFYDDNTLSNIHAELVYDQGEKAGVAIGADYFGNKPSDEDKALFRPDFKFSLHGHYSIGEKIFAGAQLAYVTPRNYINYTLTGETEYKTLKGYFDANIEVDYRYSKLLSIFVNLNNVAASKYSRWYNYPSYGFGAMAGLSYSF